MEKLDKHGKSVQNAREDHASTEAYHRIMKKSFVVTSALALASLAMLPSCKDEDKPKTDETQPPAEKQTPDASASSKEPTIDDIQAVLVEKLTPGETASVLFCRDELSPSEPGSFNGKATIGLKIEQDMYARQEAPAAFNEERKAVNEKANAAVKPDSLYLLQVGADTSMITEEMRSPKPMPDNLQEMYDDIRSLAEAAVFAQTARGGEQIEVEAQFHAQLNNETGAWEFSQVQLQDQAFSAIKAMTSKSALPADARVLSPEFEEQTKAALKEKIDAFGAAASAYIQNRENEARAHLASLQAEREEATAKAKEEAAAIEAQKTAWSDACAAQLASGSKFVGEWTRNNRFGELTLQITEAKRFVDSVHFVGSLYDTKLPEASLDITGRCDFTPGENGAKVDITIYDGQYDPDQPTAEVYDASDGMMELYLKDGKLTGVMTCASWNNTPQKNFHVSMVPAKDGKGKTKK